MRWIFILLVLTGCEAQNRAAEEAARQANYHEKCVAYGLLPGSEAYANCRQQFDIARQQEMAIKKGVVIQHLLAR